MRQRSKDRPRVRSLALLLAALLASAGCDGDAGSGPDGNGVGQRAFVVNSIGGTLSIVERETPNGSLRARNDVAALGAGANAVTLAVGEGVVAVPVAGTSSLVVFDEETLQRRCGAALPPGSSPSGVAIGGGKAYVTLLVAGQIARVDLAACAVEQVAPVGPGPVDVEVLGESLAVVIGNLDYSTGGIPTSLGESYVAFLDARTLVTRDTVSTGGRNAQFAVLDREGDLLVVNTGTFGGGNSTVASLDPVAGRLQGTPLLIGDSAVDVAVSPENRAYVTSFVDGLYVYDATANRVLRGASDPLFAPDASGGRRGSAGVAVDGRGDVLSVFFGDAATPGEVFLFADGRTLEDSVAVGIGPVGIQVEEESGSE